jgi:hypothetical protein
MNAERVRMFRSARFSLIRLQARKTVVPSMAVPLRLANTQPPERR